MDEGGYLDDEMDVRGYYVIACANAGMAIGAELGDG